MRRAMLGGSSPKESSSSSSSRPKRSGRPGGRVAGSQRDAAGEQCECNPGSRQPLPAM